MFRGSSNNAFSNPYNLPFTLPHQPINRARLREEEGACSYVQASDDGMQPQGYGRTAGYGRTFSIYVCHRRPLRSVPLGGECEHSLIDTFSKSAAVIPFETNHRQCPSEDG